jgi:hypothetical protein
MPRDFRRTVDQPPRPAEKYSPIFCWTYLWVVKLSTAERNSSAVVASTVSRQLAGFLFSNRSKNVQIRDSQ